MGVHTYLLPTEWVGSTVLYKYLHVKNLTYLGTYIRYLCPLGVE